MLAVVIALSLAFQLRTSAGLSDVRRLLAAGKLAEARQLLDSVKETGAEAAHLRGVIAFRLHDYAGAIASFRTALAGEGQRTAELRESLLLLGQSYFLSGNLPESLSVLEKAAAAGARTNEVFYMLGAGYIKTRQPERAVPAVAALFRVAPDSAAAFLLTAQLMVRHEVEDLAGKALARALELDPRLPGAHYLLGVIAIQKGEVDTGLEEFRRELNVNPNSSMAYLKMGDAYGRREEWDAAIPLLQRSIWLNPDFSAPYILLGKAYLKKTDWANAEGMLREAIRLDPENYSAHYLLGQTLMQSGQTEEGRRVLGRSQQLRRNARE